MKVNRTFQVTRDLVDASGLNASESLILYREEVWKKLLLRAWVQSILWG